MSNDTKKANKVPLPHGAKLSKDTSPDYLGTLLNEYVGFLVAERHNFSFTYGFADLQNNGVDVDFVEITFAENGEFLSTVSEIKSVLFTSGNVSVTTNTCFNEIFGKVKTEIECDNLAELKKLTT